MSVVTSHDHEIYKEGYREGGRPGQIMAITTPAVPERWGTEEIGHQILIKFCFCTDSATIFLITSLFRRLLSWCYDNKKSNDFRVS